MTGARGHYTATTALRALGDIERRRRFVEAISDAGSVDGAARAMGISSRTAWRWVHEFDIDLPTVTGAK